MEITGTVEATLDGKVLSTSGEIGEGNTPEGLATKAIQILQDAHLIESQMLLSQFKHITITQYKENYVISLKEVDGNKIVVVTRVTM